MKTAVIINKNGGNGTEATAATIRSTVEQQKDTCTLFMVTGEEIARTVEQAVQRFDKIIVGGGDGTISTAAAVLAGTSVPLGVLPLGTLNHFAKDLGLPLSPEEALDVALHGVQKRVDVAEVNGRIFINNSSLGLYPHLVKKRDGFIERLGLGKWSAMALSFFHVFGKFPLYTITAGANGTSITTATPLVFIGNNRYDISLLELGNRTRIDEGILSVYIACCSGRFCLFRFALRALFGALDQSKHFESTAMQHMRIDTRRRLVKVALDGEVATMTPPLQYRIRPQNLVVMVPKPTQS